MYRWGKERAEKPHLGNVLCCLLVPLQPRPRSVKDLQRLMAHHRAAVARAAVEACNCRGST